MKKTAEELRKEYHRAYYKKNREKLLEKQRIDIKENPDKYKNYKKTYWEKKAREQFGKAK